MYVIRSRQAADGGMNDDATGGPQIAEADQRTARAIFGPVPTLLPMRAARQNIASYVHLYGAAVTRFGEPIEPIAPAALCRVVRAALENTHEGRRERAETLVRALALSIITAEQRPLAVPRTAWDLLRRLGRQSLVARHVREAPAAALRHDLPRPSRGRGGDTASASYAVGP